MARSSSRAVERHSDRGDGTCGYCFEEFPCAVARGEKRSGGVHEWSSDAVLEEALEQSLQRKRDTDRVNEFFERWGLELEWPDFATGVLIPLEEMLKLTYLIDEEGTDWGE